MSEANRLKEVRRFLKIKQAEFAASLNSKPQQIKNIEAGSQRLPVDLAEKISEVYKINFKWLLTGKGNMLLEKEILIVPEDKDCLKIAIDKQNKGSCGVGSYINEGQEQDYITLSKFWVKNFLKASTNPENLLVVFSCGDSMEDTINDGDMLLVDKSQKEIRNGIYLVRYNNELFVKRIQVYPHEKVELISDNPKVKPIEVNKFDMDSIQVIGRVVWNGSKLPRL